MRPEARHYVYIAIKQLIEPDSQSAYLLSIVVIAARWLLEH
jgi:hypothetical protein